MIWVGIIALANIALSAYLLRENRKLTYIAIAKHAGEIAILDRPARKKSKPNESADEKSYTQWRIPSEGVGP